MDHDQHRDAVLTNAVRVFCTFVQHDVQRMSMAGIEGSDTDMLAAAVKHQMLRGTGDTISRIADRVMMHPTHMPTFTDAEDQQMLACIMTGYEPALHALRQGKYEAMQYRHGDMLNQIMQTASQVTETQATEDALDELTNSVYECLDEWEEFEPKGPFQEIVYGMVLKAETGDG